MPAPSSAVPRLAPGLASIALFLLSLSALAGKPVPPPPPPPAPPPGVTVRVSVAADGTQANAMSSGIAMTPDARYVAFSSDAGNLVAGDTNGKGDVFVHDRATGAIERVSVASDGTQANDWSYGATISADGRYVAFYSYATTLVSGEQHYYSHVYLHDRSAHTTERVSVASDGTPANSFSHDPVLSADGRYVVFSSYASNLVPGDTANYDVFVRDRVAGTTERVSLAADGTPANAGGSGVAISADGRYVLILSGSSNLVAGDTNVASDLFLFDRVTRIPERVSLGSGGVQANGACFGGVMSPDARYIAFSCDATNLVAGDTNGFTDGFVRDRVSGTTERVSVGSGGVQANAESFASGISADGNVVAMVSYASNLAPTASDWYGYGDVFVRIRSTATTEHVTVAADGTAANDESGFGNTVVSADGRFVVFDSYASNLVAGDTNGTDDVFVRERYSSP